MNDRPLTLFKYEPFSLQAIQNLKRHSIYFGPPSAFNDPFDCAIMPRLKALTDLEATTIAEHLKANPELLPKEKEFLRSASMPALKTQLGKIAQNLIQSLCEEFNMKKGISCFSAVNDNLLMWSHYGGQHRGFCLEFHTDAEPLKKLHRVTYADTIPELDIARILINGDRQSILDLFCTKSNDWSYEREWRVIHAQAGTIFTYDASALKAIYFGTKMTHQDLDLLCLILHGQNPAVALYRGHRSAAEYKIDFEPFIYKSLAEARREGIASLATK